MKLVVMMPALNEEATIGDVIRRIPRRIPGFQQVEVVVVNDDSTDRTAEVAREAGAMVITRKGRKGLGLVFRTGMEQAIRLGASVVVNIDADGQFRPEDIEALIAPIQAGRADFVTCTRFADPAFRPHMPRVKYWGNRVVAGMINRVCGSGARFTDVSCGFRAFNREAAYRLTLFGNFTYTQEVFIDLFRKGLRIEEVPLRVRGQREHGPSRIAANVLKYGMHSLLIILRTMRDTKPLKFFGGIAAGLLAMSLAGGLWLVGWYIATGRTSPFTSLVGITGVLLVLAFLLLVFGLLADMIGRHRQIDEELLYLARRRVYARDTKRTHVAHTLRSLSADDHAAEFPVVAPMATLETH